MFKIQYKNIKLFKMKHNQEAKNKTKINIIYLYPSYYMLRTILNPQPEGAEKL